MNLKINPSKKSVDKKTVDLFARSNKTKTYTLALKEHMLSNCLMCLGV